MSKTENKTVRAVVTRDFKNAGTEQEFAKDAALELSEGDFINYHAAGLVERAPDDSTADASVS
jgi:hypothetical protein